MTRSPSLHISDLRARRLRAGLTQQALAARADVSIASVGFIERGASCSPSMAGKLLVALHPDDARLEYPVSAR
jgi:DNA-binding XRE family transcriptional regulator